jgi:RNA polymerase sigma-70 factor (ECF subfamily)
VKADDARRPEAFADLYDQRFDAIWRYVAGHVGDRHTTEDLVSEVFTRALTAAPRFSARGRPLGDALAGWIFGIARHVVLDHHRREGRRGSSVPLDGPTLDTLADDAPGPEELALRAQDAALLRTAVARLAPDQREALALRYWAGLSPEETAAVMRRPPGTIRALAFRALRRLRAELTEVTSDGTRTERTGKEGAPHV